MSKRAIVSHAWQALSGDRAEQAEKRNLRRGFAEVKTNSRSTTARALGHARSPQKVCRAEDTVARCHCESALTPCDLVLAPVNLLCGSALACRVSSCKFAAVKRKSSTGSALHLEIRTFECAKCAPAAPAEKWQVLSAKGAREVRARSSNCRLASFKYKSSARSAHSHLRASSTKVVCEALSFSKLRLPNRNLLCVAVVCRARPCSSRSKFASLKRSSCTRAALPQLWVQSRNFSSKFGV